MVTHPYTLTAKHSFSLEHPSKSASVRICSHIWNITIKKTGCKTKEPLSILLYPSWPQVFSPQITMQHSIGEAKTALCGSDWKTGPALKSQHIIFPQGYFFKLIQQKASLQQHWQGQRQMSEKQIPAVISALMIPLVELWSETCFHHKKITVETHWLWCIVTPTQFHHGTLCPLQNLNHKSPLQRPKCVNFSEVLVAVLL